MLQNIFISKSTLTHSVLDKDIIKREIVPHLPLAKRGFQATVPLEERIHAILYELKTGAQWHQLPVEGIIAVLKGMAARKDRSEVLKNFSKPKYLLLAEEDPLIPAPRHRTGSRTTRSKHTNYFRRTFKSS